MKKKKEKEILKITDYL